MKQELDLIRSTEQPADSLDGSQFARAETTVINPHRAVIRQATDMFIREGLQVGDLAKVATAAAASMLNVATVLSFVDLEPTIDDFVDGAAALLETARSVIDRGLMIRDAATVMQGACMIEQTIRGVCACLGVDYDRVLPLVFKGDDEALAAMFHKEKTE